jgi:NTE family protein
MFFRPKLGLTLGGGGARGGAHLGVLRVLTELGYKPDVVVGTSIGGFIAAMIGAGWTIDQIESFFYDTDFASMISLDRTGRGLVSTRSLEALLYSHFGDADLRELSPKVALVASDVRHHHRILIERGPVVKAILASSAIPGLFPPVEWGEYLLVDGAVTDNLPTQATYQLGAQRVVAVDIGGYKAGIGLTLDEMGTLAKQVQRALYWLLSLSKRQAAFDTLVESSRLSFSMLVHYQLAMFPPDVLIRPVIPDNVKVLSMERMREAAKAGKRAARQMAPQIRAIMKRRRWKRAALYSLPPLITAQPYPDGNRPALRGNQQ